jgi:hypothetical protein
MCERSDARTRASPKRRHVASAPPGRRGIAHRARARATLHVARALANDGSRDADGRTSFSHITRSRTSTRSTVAEHSERAPRDAPRDAIASRRRIS